MSCELTLCICSYCVAGSDKSCSRRDIIQILSNCCLIRHGYIEASDLESSECLDALLNIV